VRYIFIEEHRPLFSVRAMCRCLRIHPSGFYAWLKNPLCKRAAEDSRQTELIKEAWKDSGKVYGYRKLHDDLCDLGETCCPNRVARLAQLAGIRAQIGYKRRPGKYGGKPSVAVDNTLDRQFDVDAPDRFWVTDITYIKTYEGYSYLAVVIDLYSRKVVGPLSVIACNHLSVSGIDAITPAHRSGAAGFAYGRLAQKICRQSLGAFRSGQPVYQPGMGVISKASQFGAQYEPPRKLS